MFITCDELLACSSSSTPSDPAALCERGAGKSTAASASHTLKQTRRSMGSVKKRTIACYLDTVDKYNVKARIQQTKKL
jgi:hypothetical protein